jgi:hypothetical protein
MLKIQRHLTNYFKVKRELMTTLLNTFLEKALRNIQINPNRTIFKRTIQYLAYTDNVAILEQSMRNEKQKAIKAGLGVNANKTKHMTVVRSRDSVVGIATGYRLDDRGVGVRVPVGSRIFSSPRRPDRLWGPTQPPIQWVPWALSPGVSGRGVKLTTHLQLVLRSRKCGSIHSLPRTPSWRSAYLSTGTSLPFT